MAAVTRGFPIVAKTINTNLVDAYKTIAEKYKTQLTLHQIKSLLEISDAVEWGKHRLKLLAINSSSETLEIAKWCVRQNDTVYVQALHLAQIHLPEDALTVIVGNRFFNHATYLITNQVCTPSLVMVKSAMDDPLLESFAILFIASLENLEKQKLFDEAIKTQNLNHIKLLIRGGIQPTLERLIILLRISEECLKELLPVAEFATKRALFKHALDDKNPNHVDILMRLGIVPTPDEILIHFSVFIDACTRDTMQGLIINLSDVYQLAILQNTIDDRDIEVLALLIEDCQLKPTVEMCLDVLNRRAEFDVFTRIFKTLFSLIDAEDRMKILRHSVLANNLNEVTFLLNINHQNVFFIQSSIALKDLAFEAWLKGFNPIVNLLRERLNDLQSEKLNMLITSR